MRGPGQAVLALAFVGAMTAAAVGADRIGTAPPGPAPSATVSSARWVCPHGGGDGWTGRVVIMNPGDEPADVRITTFGKNKDAVTTEATVPASRQLVHEVPASDPAAATVVDAFGPWVGVAWLVSSEDPGGLGAEPCLPGGARRWLAGDPGTPQGERATLVVSNPYDADAIVDVALYSADRPPIRAEPWTDLEIGARRSVALSVNRIAEGEEALLAEVTAEVGRVAVASFVTGRDGGIRSAAATPTASGPVHHLPVAGGEGATTLLVGVPSESEVRFAPMLLGTDAPQAAGGLTDGEQTGPSSRAYPVTTAGPSSARVEVDAGADVALVLRALGRSVDGGATAGTSTTASAWVVPSTVLGEPSFPALVIVNPGQEEVAVTLRHLPAGEGAAGTEARVVVPPGSAVAAPEDFLAAQPRAAMLVRADDGEVVALGASASRGVQGFARYALVVGLPLPGG